MSRSQPGPGFQLLSYCVMATESTAAAIGAAFCAEAADAAPRDNVKAASAQTGFRMIFSPV
jgi:hypothetical protein